jgi:dTDP-4-dehydrorhamnose 3,5-epimerase
MEGIHLTPLKIITGEGGNVLHALKNVEDSFSEFGEAYFSTVKHNTVKGWKKHTIMVSNLVVPVGEIQFVFYDDRPQSKSFKQFYEVILSSNNYQRLTVQPGIWMAFKGIGPDLNLLLNISSITHDPRECELLSLENDIIPNYFG